jgi:hypothetical protein
MGSMKTGRQDAVPRGSPSFGESFYLRDATLRARVVRNIRLLRYVLGLAWWWGLGGRPARRALRIARQRGTALVVEEPPS